MSAYAQFGYYPTASQLLVSGGQPTTATSPAMSSSAGALSPGALSPSSTATTATTTGGAASGNNNSGGAGGTSTPVGGSSASTATAAIAAAAAAASTAAAAVASTGCCENGRPMMTDPVTGQTVCSCQYDSAARLALSAYPRLGPGASGYSSYPTPTPSGSEQGPYTSIGMDSSAFYSPLGNPYGLKDATGMGMTADMGAAAAWGTAALQPAATGYYPYDPTLAAYGYGAGYDLAARRKNATRESTATLKAWLNEHKKNPYPTKGEKIMLAIITKMTLTQVSTWFANARRRLKKENKMTWEPKNKTDDDDDAALSDSEDNKDKDEMGGDNRDSRIHGDDGRREPMRHVKAEHMHHDKDLDDEDDLDLEDDPRRVGAENPYHHAMHHHHHHHPHHHHAYGPDEHNLKDDVLKSDCGGAGVPIPATKPKIWSLADTAACKTPPPLHHPYHLHHHQQQQQQQQQHYSQQHQHHHQQHHQHQQHQHHLSSQPQHHSQQPWLGGGGGSLSDPNAGGSLGNFALPAASMSPSSAATAPYSSSSARYGGFLSSSSGGQLHYNPNSSSGSSVSSASSSAAAGFPEVGTDTPPQTPPNMKVGTPNGVIQGPPTGYCPGGSSSNSSTPNSNVAAVPLNPGHYTAAATLAGAYMQQSNAGMASNNNNAAGAYNSRIQNSPHKDFSSATQNAILHQHQTTASLPPTEATTAFKPFYKGSQTMGSGFVSPV